MRSMCITLFPKAVKRSHLHSAQLLLRFSQQLMVPRDPHGSLTYFPSKLPGNLLASACLPSHVQLTFFGLIVCHKLVWGPKVKGQSLLQWSVITGAKHQQKLISKNRPVWTWPKHLLQNDDEDDDDNNNNSSSSNNNNNISSNIKMNECMNEWFIRWPCFQSLSISPLELRVEPLCTQMTCEMPISGRLRICKFLLKWLQICPKWV